MRRAFTVTTIATAALAALAMLAGPASAAQITRGGPGGPGGPGPNATGFGLNVAPSGTLTTAQKADLVHMIEEEKLAHDVYVTLAAKYPSVWQFNRIQGSETQHQAALRSIGSRYGVTDPSSGEAVGEFNSAAFRTLFADLISQTKDATSALAVGVAVEKLDIADLTSALSGLDAPDLQQVYTNLRSASQHHLYAFGG